MAQNGETRLTPWHTRRPCRRRPRDRDRTADGEPALIGAAFDALDRAGGPWSLLRGEAELAASGGDVDCSSWPAALAAGGA